MWKRIFLTSIILGAFIFDGMSAYALEEVFDAQLEAIDTKEIMDTLDDETKSYLEDIGVDISYDFASGSLDYEAILDQLCEIVKISSSQPLKSCTAIFSLIIIFAILQGIRDSAGDNEMYETADFVISAVACAALSFPIADFISETGDILIKGCDFASVIAPIVGAVGIASGSAFASSNYNAFILVMVELISLSTGKIVMPLLKVMLAISSISAISKTVTFDKLIFAIEKNTKWVLTLIAAVMVGVLNISSIAASGIDVAASKAIKLVVSTAVPIIGGSIGDAIGTICGSIGIIRTTIGAFGMIATGFIFLPTILKSFIWTICLDVCSNVAEMFSLGRITKIFKAFSSIIAITLSLLIFVLVVFIASSAIALK